MSNEEKDSRKRKKIVVNKRKKQRSKRTVRKRTSKMEDSTENPLLSRAPRSSTAVKFLERRNAAAKRQAEQQKTRHTQHGISEERDLRNLEDDRIETPTFVKKILRRF